MLDLQKINLLAYGTDSYKVSHWNFYPEGTTLVYSYGEPRNGGMFPNVTFFGLQYILTHLEGEFVTTERIDEAERVAEDHIGPYVFNRAGWEYIRDNFNGRIPLRIRALPEGMTIPESNCLFTVENLGGEATKWLTNWFETIISHAWYPTTVMTSSREIRKVILKYLEKTGDPAGLPFKIHDFGMRGVSCLEQAAIGGGAHLATGAMGTDTMIALWWLKEYYGANEMPAFSIRATEHSIMTARGEEGEADVVRQVLDNTPSDQMVAMVGDSYDMLRFVREILALPDIKARIEARTAPVVVRPDSGTLPKIDVDVYWALVDVFGDSINDKGYSVLAPCVAMIQGDGIKWNRVQCTSGPAYVHTVEIILEAFERQGISADNIAFGSGGGLLQQFDRDSQRFAIKCSYAERDGKGFDIYKRPATDPTKNSKRGRLAVVPCVEKEFVTVSEAEGAELCLMHTVFETGERQNLTTLNEVRERAALRVNASV
jgi:nicotinamide phosphoribosyltransferase